MRISLLILTLAAAGLFGPAAPAARSQGVVVTTLPEPMGMSSDFFSALYPVDLDGDAVPDFTFGAEPGFIGLRTERANQLIYRIDPPPNLGGRVARLEGGFQVGASLEPELGWRSSDLLGGYVSPGEIAFVGIVQCLNTGCGSDWPGGPSSRAFIGIEFELADGMHYGYFDIRLRGDIPGATLFGWAYESSPNTPITAHLVPEPSALALLLVGGLFLVSCRRR